MLAVQRGQSSVRAVGGDLKGKISPLFHLVGILSALFVDTHGKLGVVIGTGCYTIVALIWIVPDGDRRIGRAVHESRAPD
ncbi:hypothetical protein [Frankia tisae]|uniref:hypothetical protein n=1 Tax=Frankia tisae TaxID=2950104 RepID=UPI0021C21183|nr:hypothetical protein [Frankia tisae]